MKSIVILLTLALFPLFPKAHAASEPYQGPIYIAPVPQDEPELLPYAKFPLGPVGRSEKNGIVTILYPLPFELTGVNQMIELQGPVPTAGHKSRLSGAHAKALCDDHQCAITFSGLEHDFPILKQQFLVAGMNSQEMGLRLRLANHFVDDPHGIMIFRRSH